MNLLTPDEVAVILKIERRTVLRWLKQGKLPGIMLESGIATQWRVDGDELDRYLESLKSKWAAAANLVG